MTFKLFAIPLLLGVALTVAACETPETETEIETTDPAIEQPVIEEEPAGLEEPVTEPDLETEPVTPGS